MGSLFERQESATPEALGPSTGPLLEAQRELAGLFSGPNNPLGDIFGQGAQNFGLDPRGLLGILQGQIGSGQNFIQQGRATGFGQDIGSQLEAALRPTLDRSFARGSADIREQAAGLGALSSSGTVQNLQDFRGGLENQLLQQVGGAQTQGLLQGQGIRGALAQGQQGQLPAILQQILQQQQFSQRLPGDLLAQQLGASGQAQFFQPTSGPSKGENLLGSAAQGAGLAATKGMGGAASAATGGGGGGGGGK